MCVRLTFAAYFYGSHQRGNLNERSCVYSYREVVTERTPIYKLPSRRADKIKAKVAKGKEYNCEGVQGKWAKIRLKNGSFGYLFLDNVCLEDRTEPEKTEPEKSEKNGRLIDRLIKRAR